MQARSSCSPVADWFAFVTGVPDQSWDESAPAGAGFGQDAPAAPAADEWGAAPAAGAAGQPSFCLVLLALTCIEACIYTCHIGHDSAQLSRRLYDHMRQEAMLSVNTAIFLQMDGMQPQPPRPSRLSSAMPTSLVPSTRSPVSTAAGTA